MVCDSDDGRRACRDKRPGSILVIWREGIGDDMFASSLNPCTYLRKLPLACTVDQIIDAVATHLRFTESIVWREIYEKPKRTPILLPVRNFEADRTSNLLAALQDYPADAERLIENFRSSWFDPGYRCPKGGRPGGFLDSRQIGFSKDRKRHDRRVSRQDDKLRTGLRLLRAFYRLGTPYEVGFHYDVCRPRGAKPRPLNAHFWNAAKEINEYRTDSYLNIAPDDEIR
jgi:hypothetical protein